MKGHRAPAAPPPQPDGYQTQRAAPCINTSARGGSFNKLPRLCLERRSREQEVVSCAPLSKPKMYALSSWSCWARVCACSHQRFFGNRRSTM